MGGKKKKKDPIQALVPIFDEPPAPEEEQEEVQFTDTSYTSASWEDVPPLPVVEDTKKKKKKKKDEEEEVKKEASDMFQWSEESFPEDQPVVEEEKKEPKEKKEKKEKKKKKGKKDEEEIPDFEKPKNWKKMDKKAQDKWMKERIEQWRAEVEAERQAKLAGAKEKRLREARERAELLVRDNEAMEVRRDILQRICRVMQRFENQKKAYENKKQMKAEWRQYLKCDGLPDPRIVMQMATYLHVWKERAVYDDDELDTKCKEVLPMLEMLEGFVANARLYTPQQAANYNEIRLQLRDQLAIAIEFASYSVLRNLEEKMKWPSVKLCTYQRVFRGLKLNLWVAVRMPTHKPIVKEYDIYEPVELEFPGIKVTVTLPSIVDAEDICVRASRSLIDLLSERSRTFNSPMQLPDQYMDLFVFNVKEHVEVLKKKDEQDTYRKAFYKAVRERTRELENLIKSNVYLQMTEEKKELEQLYLAEPPIPLPDPRLCVGEQNEQNFKAFLKKCNLRVRSGEVNLRKYRICGGVMYLDLLVTPPQAKRMENGIHITRLELPKSLRWVDYKVQYRTPVPPPGLVRTPEEIEREMIIIQKEYEKLALVFIELTHDVLWNEPPLLVQWQDQRHLWTSNYINDFKYNEEKQTVQFRTGVLWPVGLACLRYSNLPYQTWDIKPNPKNRRGVVLTVTGLCVTCTWHVQGNSVKLIFIANASTMALKEHFNKKYSVKQMVQLMRSAACDFFPDFDAHNYVIGSCPKEWAMERHLYHTMALLCRAYNFQWSRWNVQQGFRRIVVQLREAVDPKRESRFGLLLVTPGDAVVLRGDENMQEWSDAQMQGMEFYPDLFALNLAYGSIDARRTVFDMKFKVVETLFNFLVELKLCSFS